MQFTEQNISTAKLEKLRQDAIKKTKILRRLPLVCFAVFAALALIQDLGFFRCLADSGWGDPVTKGAFFHLLGGLMMAAMLASVVYLFYMIFVWQKAYDRFNFSFKNKYVLDTIRQLPGFSALRYDAQGGFSYQEMDRMNLIPKGGKAFYQSTDALSGLLDGVRFCSSNVKTGRQGHGRSSLPDILFEGQVLAFSTFDERKLSDGFVQVFSKKALSKAKPPVAPLEIQTENSLFHENFVVFAENEQNAFYILTPRVLEKITAFQEAVEGKVYLSFFQSTLYVTCSQFRNPFDAYIDIPIPEQQKNLVQDTALLRKARELLLCIGENG